ncbi:MAG: hypothetical protein JW974_01905 [Alphaproteobacteria bacterium]|nr:hypothetical protein [Alphaproteobacteria bacterium]MBN2675534.1 hypothetical protein [Alphaproteobacteria bacterium]
MLKAKLIQIAVKFIMGAIALGVGIWYLSSSIGGASIGYTSLNSFLSAIGVQNGDIASANGCFLCGYIEKLFAAIGNAAENFWIAMVDNIWILLAIGFGIFLFYTTIIHLYDASKKNVSLDESEKKIEFKPWFDKIWKQGVRVMMAGALLGILGFGGTIVLKQITNITITPVMFVGAELSMAATGVSDSAQCGTSIQNDDILNPVLKPFMCVVGNLNTVMLAGAAGGFSLMNYSWMGMGGGLFTWLAGLALVIMFLVIGFNLFFDILSVIFKLVFLIIFLPLIIAAGAFEGTWGLANGVVSNSINMLVKSAIRIVAIALKILITYAIVSFAADEYFPGPNDGYNAILPPLVTEKSQKMNDQALSVMSVFSNCEKVSIVNGAVDKELFKNCFTANRAQVERRYPGAFDFMGNGFEFLLLWFGIFFLYFYVMSQKIDTLLGKDSKEEFDYGNWIKDLGKRIWGAPAQITEQITKATEKK